MLEGFRAGFVLAGWFSLFGRLHLLGSVVLIWVISDLIIISICVLYFAKVDQRQFIKAAIGEKKTQEGFREEQSASDMAHVVHYHLRSFWKLLPGAWLPSTILATMMLKGLFEDSGNTLSTSALTIVEQMPRIKESLHF